MVCLDTDFLVALIRGDAKAEEKAKILDRRGVRKVTTPINVFELYLGAYLSRNQNENVKLIRDLLLAVDLLGFDHKSSEKAGEIAAKLKKIGQPIGVRDSMIAGIAARFEQILLTRNLNHFSKVNDLEVEQW
ncbi:MAG: type II toxin-antitoxin system VapC family toxin [Thermoproteota archaeon]